MYRIRLFSIFLLLFVPAGLSTAQTNLPGDINGDRSVDIVDLRMLGLRWLDDTCVFPDCPADIAGGDGVDLFDLAELAANWRHFDSPLVISEFMASNDNTWMDDDGDSSDWIEIFNPSQNTASLGRFYLTDDPADLMKWRFPDGLTVNAGKYFLVYASGKDRKDPAAGLHTNFRIDRRGEYLALVAANGRTVVNEFAPQFPEQLVDVSYGIRQGTITETLVPENAPKSVLVPQGPVDDAWKGGNPSFDDSAWNDGLPTIGGTAGGVGYERSSGYQSYISYDVESKMYGINGTCYIRIPFDIDPARVSLFSSLTLKVRHDDAFVAYLNGQEVTRTARVPSTLAWNSRATTNRPSDSTFLEEFDITPHVGRLQEHNILAFHGLNGANTTSSDFLISAELIAGGAEIIHHKELTYFKNPSPGRVNGNGFTPFLIRPEFSQAGRLFTDSFDLTLSVESPGMSIHYTLNNSSPSRTSNVYTNPIPITATTQVRARIYGPNNEPGPVVSHTYLKLQSDALDFNSDLSVIVIDTHGQSISTDPYRRVSAVFLDPGPDGRTTLTGSIDYAGIGGIKKRGSSTAGVPKPSFAFEVWDEDNEDLDVSLFGFDDESDWVFYSPYNYDRALISNALAYDLSNQVGRYAVRTKFVEIFLNTNGGSITSSDYFGLYIFMEKIKRDPKRVDVESLSNSYTTEPLITGGYITKIDRLDPGDSGFRTTQRGLRIGYVYPKERLIPSHQSAWIRNYFNEFEAALYGSNFRDPELGYAAYIDVDSWLDHNLVNMLTMNVDALRLSTYMHKRRGKKLEMGPIWDFDRAMESTDGRDNNPSSWHGTGDGTDYFTWGWWDRIFDDPDFMLRYTDRWYRFRKDQFSTENLFATIDRLADEIREAQARHYQRWSDKPPRFGGFQGEIDHMKYWFETRANWVDGQFFRPPVFSHNGGQLASATSLTITRYPGTSGQIYYTTDGTDPRRAVTGAAVGTLYTAPVRIPNSIVIKARVKNGTQWSAINEAAFSVGPVADNLRITELMYHPSIVSDPNDRDAEFIELKNIGAQSINLNLVRFTNGVDFTFPNMTLDPGQYTLVIKNDIDFARRHPGFDGDIAGTFIGSLDNGGEKIELVDAIGEAIEDFKYNDGWYEITDGLGFSLTVRDTAAGGPDHFDVGLAGQWRLDEIAGSTAADSSGAGLHGTVAGSATWRPDTGKIDGALEFDGLDSRVKIDGYKGILGSAGRTCTAWIKSDAPGNDRMTIVSWGNDNPGGAWHITLDRAAGAHPGSLRLAVVGGRIAGTTNLCDNKWHHVAVVLPDDGSADVSEAILYVDGKAEAISGTVPRSINTGDTTGGLGSNDVLIGVFYRAGTELPFTGMVDNLCIYNRPLSKADIKLLADEHEYRSTKDYWWPSAAAGGSPGRDDSGDIPAPPGSVIINEVLAHSDLLEHDWIELHNTTDSDIYIGDWFISDNDLNFKKFQIPAGTWLVANGFTVFTEDQFNTAGAPGCLEPFALSENGEKLYLHSGQADMITGYAEERNFGPSDPDVSMGLYIIPSTGEDDFVAMAEITEGTPNSYPKVGPIVISEIMYHPAIEGDAEYIELLNIGTQSETLYEYARNEAWHVEGINDFQVLDNGQPVTMNPGERILLVRDIALFGVEFTADPSVKLVLEWQNGSLQNGGENIELVKPGDYDTDSVLQYIVVDSADYSDGAHPENGRPDLWPTEPDGGIDTNGDGIEDKSIALQRTPQNAYGDDPLSWTSADPTPGG